MVSAIKGTTVKLIVKSQNGEDDFGHPIFTETEVDVDNVLIEPASNEAIVSELEVNGKHIAYILHIPKSDAHTWKDTTVKFYGQTFKTYGDCLVYDENLTPLSWNKKVKVECYE